MNVTEMLIYGFCEGDDLVQSFVDKIEKRAKDMDIDLKFLPAQNENDIRCHKKLRCVPDSFIEWVIEEFGKLEYDESGNVILVVYHDGANQDKVDGIYSLCNQGEVYIREKKAEDHRRVIDMVNDKPEPVKGFIRSSVDKR